MEQPIDRATIVNRALAKIGQAPSFSPDAEDFLGGTVDAVWPDCVDHCFGLHDWPFARVTRRLTRLAEDALGWGAVFQLPGDMLGQPVKVTRTVQTADDIVRDVSIENGRLYANEQAIWIRAKVAVDPGSWEPGFRSAFTVALASMLAIPLQQDEGLAANMWEQAFGPPSQGGAGGLFGRLIAQARTAGPVASPLLRDDPLTSARW